MNPTRDELAAACGPLIDLIADRVADRVLDRLRPGPNGLIDQASSPLGSRRHIALVRRGEGFKIGRRYLATHEAVMAEAKRLSAKAKKTPSEALASECRLRLVSR